MNEVHLARSPHKTARSVGGRPLIFIPIYPHS